MKQHDVNVWLVNTGWSGGSHGVGSRVKLGYTRAIIDAIHAGALIDAQTTPDPVFGIGVVMDCPGVPREILIPRQTWSDPAAYDATARRLSTLFRENFRQYESVSEVDLRQAGPVG